MTAHVRLLRRDASVALTHRDAAARPQSFDAEARTIEAIVATDQPVRRRDAVGEFLEILDPAGADLEGARGASVLDSHMQHGLDNVLGVIDDIWREGNEIIARIRFSAREDIADRIADVAAGILRSLSVGYEVSEWREGTDANGVRTMTATKWSPREVSFVSVGADSRARTRTRARSVSPAGRASINRSIRELGQRAGLAQETIDDLIDRGATIEEARSEALTEMMVRGQAPIRSSRHNDQSTDNPQVRIRAMSEALYVRVRPAHQPTGQARQFVGLSIPDIARECCRRAGVQLSGLSSAVIVTRALHATSDFPAVIADTVNRTLRDAYRAAPSGLRSVARERTANDFRTMSRVQLDSTAFELELVTETGEFKRGSMQDSKESYKIATYGKIFGISRQALVNDDLGAFTDLSSRLGQQASAFEAQALVDLLVGAAGNGPNMDDAKAMFHTDHGNINTAAGAAPSETTLSAARLAMRKQTAPGGGLLDIVPWALVVPPDLETATEKVLTAIQATKTDDTNVFATLRLVVEPRLTDAYRWYVTINPATMDGGLEFAYLAGFAGPQIESRAGFDVDGVEVKVRLDYGAGVTDHRGWYRDAGH